MFWGRTVICLQEHREITLKHFGGVSEVSLVSAGQTERKLDRGWGGGGGQWYSSGNNQRFVVHIAAETQ